MFWILRRVFGFWEVFWIAGETCFWILGGVLDSGKCFWILGRVFGFWEVFWILGRVFGFWEMFLDSETCFVPTSHGKRQLLLWLSRGLNRPVRPVRSKETVS